ncbi:hypothetical protein CYR52_07560 [Chimaeribacter arupi]|nr:hypothetical protein CYR52_07560 [Chimaeribacter arupi]
MVTLGYWLLGACLFSILMTIIFVYVSNDANRRVEDIRKDYGEVASRRDEKVEQLSNQVADLQKKLDSLPDRTANKTADKVKQVVKEDEGK